MLWFDIRVAMHVPGRCFCALLLHGQQPILHWLYIGFDLALQELHVLLMAQSSVLSCRMETGRRIYLSSDPPDLRRVRGERCLSFPSESI